MTKKADLNVLNYYFNFKAFDVVESDTLEKMKVFLRGRVTSHSAPRAFFVV